MQRNVIETVIGAVVLLVAAGFVIFAYRSADLSDVDGYVVQAKFDDASGVGPGSDVRVGGIKVGVVESLSLDPESYRAVLTLLLSEETELPKDSTAAIVGDGLLGSKFVTIQPGADTAMLEEDDIILYTQSSVNIEELIGKMVYSGGGVDSGNAPEAGNSTLGLDEDDEGLF